MKTPTNPCLFGDYSEQPTHGISLIDRQWKDRDCVCIIYYTYIFEYNTATKQENRVAYREVGINHHAKKDKPDLERQISW